MSRLIINLGQLKTVAMVLLSDKRTCTTLETNELEYEVHYPREATQVLTVAALLSARCDT